MSSVELKAVTQRLLDSPVWAAKLESLAEANWYPAPVIAAQ